MKSPDKDTSWDLTLKGIIDDEPVVITSNPVSFVIENNKYNSNPYNESIEITLDVSNGYKVKKQAPVSPVEIVHTCTIDIKENTFEEIQKAHKRSGGPKDAKVSLFDFNCVEIEWSTYE